MDFLIEFNHDIKNLASQARGCVMSHQYQPPFTITPLIATLVGKISETVGRLTILREQSNSLRLRRINRIRTIRGSLAIEGNQLTEAQVTAILDGKRVIAPPREIQEVRNALVAYERFDDWNPRDERELIEAHRILMSGLIDEAGSYRRGGVGVMEGSHVIHMAPPADRVPTLMGDLFQWLTTSEAHPLIASSVFHYEFEFIHPFADGNGRMGRLWQSLILARWNNLFADLPVENLVFEHQSDYYHALQKSTQQADSSHFIEFILAMIFDAVVTSTPQAAPQVTPQVGKLLLVINGEMSREELQDLLHLQDRKSFRARYLSPALADGFIEMTITEKPNSPLQRYQITEKGRQWLLRRER